MEIIVTATLFHFTLSLLDYVELMLVTSTSSQRLTSEVIEKRNVSSIRLGVSTLVAHYAVELDESDFDTR